MKQQRSVLYNFIMNVILTMSSFIFPLIAFPYVSRILLPVGTGKVAFASSVVNYFLLLAQLGIPTYGIRACAKVRDDKEKLSKTVQEILFIHICMCVAAYILFFFTLFCVPKFQEERKLLIVTSASILCTTLGVEWFFKALERYSYITWRSILFKCIGIIAMFLLVHEQGDYVIYGGISIFASSASGLLNFIYLHKFVDLKKRFKLDLKPHIKPILILFAMSCATNVYLNMDTTMLGFMQTDADVGYYNAAVKIRNMLVSIVTSLGAVLLPRVTVYLENNQTDKFMKLSQKAIYFVLFVSLPMVVFFILFAEQGILLFSGKEYVQASIPMQIMMPTLLFIGLTNIMGIQILVPMGKESKVLVSTIIGAVIDLILNIILIPKYSVAGAAIGTAVAEVAVFMYQYFSERVLFKDLFKNINPCKFVLASMIAALCSIWILELNLSNLVSLALECICFSLVYMVSLLLFREVFIKEIIDMVLSKRR